MTVRAGVGVKNISRGDSELNWNDSVILELQYDSLYDRVIVWGPIHERSQRAVARATSQTVCDRHRTCDTTYSRNVSQNLRPVARAIVYATSHIHSSTLLRPTSKWAWLQMLTK